jgi:hypothetical protein
VYPGSTNGPDCASSCLGSRCVSLCIVDDRQFDDRQPSETSAYSQLTGLTVAVLIASAVLAGTNSQNEKAKEPEDHSWRNILGEWLYLYSSRKLQDLVRVRLICCAEAEGDLSPADRKRLREVGGAEEKRRELAAGKA